MSLFSKYDIFFTKVGNLFLSILIFIRPNFYDEYHKLMECQAEEFEIWNNFMQRKDLKRSRFFRSFVVLCFIFVKIVIHICNLVKLQKWIICLQADTQFLMYLQQCIIICVWNTLCMHFKVSNNLLQYSLLNIELKSGLNWMQLWIVTICINVRFAFLVSYSDLQ